MGSSYRLVLTVMFCCLTTGSHAQVSTGTPKFGSFAGGPDLINLGNLNVFWNIPIINKAGRGTSFQYNLGYNSSVWYPATSNGITAWTPVTNWGWQGLSAAGTSSYASYNVTTSAGYCGQYGNVPWESWSYSNVIYVDQLGVIHPFGAGGTYYSVSGGSQQYCPPNGANPSQVETVSASDGSGMKVSWLVGEGSMSLTFYDANGNTISPVVVTGSSPSQGQYSTTDRNGNQVSNNGNGVFTDTLGTTALSISGSAPSNTVLQYPNPAGGESSYTVSYKSYTIQTNFNCSSVHEYSASGVNLVDRITLPDGRYYQFAYEASGGNYPAADVTGRIASIQLPSGGTISYAYSGGNNGIECQDGSTAGMSRTTPDGTWAYSRTSSSSTQWTTTVTDPTQDQTAISFITYTTNQNGSPVNFAEISRKVYSGSVSSGSVIRTILTCYNSSSFCDPTLGDNQATMTVQPVWRQVTVEMEGNANKTYKGMQSYDGNGNVTENDDYDVGSNGNAGGLLRKTLISYQSFTNSNAPTNLPASVTVEDGSGNIASQTDYRYDEGITQSSSNTPQHVTGTNYGNLTTLVQCIGASCSNTAQSSSAGAELVSKFSYWDTGMLNTATDVNGAVTTYGYSSGGSCGNSFPTSVGQPLGLGTSATWDCNGGVEIAVTDLNGNTTNYSYTDPNNPANSYYWVVRKITDQWGNVTTEAYPGEGASGNTSEAAMNFNSGGSTSDVLTQYDWAGRVQLSEQRQAPYSTTFNVTSSSYDSLGRLYFQSLPYPSGGTNPPGITMQYDALNRLNKVLDSGGGTTTYGWTGTDLLTTLGPAPSGENTKSRQLEYDGAGRLTSVCEVTGASGSGTCGQQAPLNGYWTQYTYDAASRLTKVLQNAQSSGNTQSRLVSYDWLGRKTQETIPETGTVHYTYDSDSTCGTSYGDLVKVQDAVGNVTCMTYDAMHRELSANTVQGSYSGATPQVHYVYDSASLNGTAMQNVKGSVAEAYTCTGSCSSKITDMFFSAVPDGTGRLISEVWESTPNSSGYYLTEETDYQNGAVGAISAFLNGNAITGMPSMIYGVDGMGRPITATDTAHSNQKVASAACYTSGGRVAGVKLGNGDSDAFSYDWSTLNPTSFQYNITGSDPFTVSGSLAWNANSSLKSMTLTDTNDSSKNQNCTYAADDLQRLTQVSCGSAWAQSFSYDSFGNISKSGSSGYAATYGSGTNQENNGYATYDQNGNLTQQSFTGGLNWTFNWNAAGEPWNVNGVTATYDALGRLVEFSSGGAYPQVIYLPSGAKLALMQGAALLKATLPMPGGMEAVYNSGGLAYIRHMDYLGSSRLATTWTHGVYSKESYAPFGETYNEAGTADRSFTGQDQNTTSGIYDFLFRRYDPVTGRWLSPDPAGWSAADLTNPQSLNRYAYVMNNAMSYVDFLGLGTGYFWRDGCFYSFQYSDSYGAGGVTVTGAPDEVSWCVLELVDPSASCPTGETCGGTTGGGGGGGAPNDVSKHYGITIPCTSSAADVMNFVQTSFGTFGNYSRWAGEESVTFSPPNGMGVGSTIPISVGTFGIFQTLSVNVASINSQSMTFTTNPGHLLYPASITFSASPAAQGSVNFNINLGGTIANPFEFYLGGGNFEDAQWNHFLGQVGSYCKQQ